MNIHLSFKKIVGLLFIAWSAHIFNSAAAQTISERNLLRLAETGGDLSHIEELLKSGANPNALDEIENNPITYATRNNHAEIVAVLLNYGADANAKSASGQTSLMYAARNDNEHIITILLDGGANIDEQDNRGITALGMAAITGKETALKVLISRGADLNIKSNQGTTALQFAIDQDQPEMAELLIAAGASQDIHSEFALSNAALSGDLELVRQLIGKNDINWQDNEQMTAVYKAAANGHTEIVRLLIESDADVNIVSEKKTSPLTIAIYNEHDEIANLLLNADADIDAKSDTLGSPLIMAAYRKKYDLLHLLIDKGADVNHTMDSGETALILTLQQGSKKYGSDQVSEAENAALKLIEVGANPYLTSERAGPAIFFALANDYDLAIEKLMEYPDFDVNYADVRNQTPLFFAAQNGHVEAAKYLLKIGANPKISSNRLGSPFLSALRNEHKEIAELLLSGSDDFDFVLPRSRHTAIIFASQFGYTEIVRSLIASGVNLDAQSTDGYTALFLAANRGHEEIVELLLQSGVDTSLEDKEGRNAATVARTRKIADLINDISE